MIKLKYEDLCYVRCDLTTRGLRDLLSKLPYRTCTVYVHPNDFQRAKRVAKDCSGLSVSFHDMALFKTTVEVYPLVLDPDNEDAWQVVIGPFVVYCSGA